VAESASPTQQVPAPPRRSLSTLLTKGIPLVVAGAIGAGIAVGISAAVDSGGTTTVVQSSAPGTIPPAEENPAQVASTSQALTVQEIYELAGPGVVQVSVSPDGAPGGLEGQGSGFVIDKAGHIVTNYHVVQNAGEVQVSFSAGESVAATVVGVDPSTDIAVLKVDMPASALQPLPLGDSNEVQVGDSVVAIGNPFGLERTVTAGIVSALQREIEAPNGFEIDQVIQTDAQINSGNSGGPLLNTRGEVIGVNSQIETGGTGLGNVGIGFAVPVNTVREAAAQLIETGKVERAFLGIEMQTITEEAAHELRLPVDAGVLIATVRPGSPAADAGLRGGDDTAVVNGETWVLGGDVIVGADGNPIETADELRDVVLSKRPGDDLTLDIDRDGETLTLTVELGRQPATPSG
jgi:S1-C subfamily serine protease